jgi:hypothetical protein
VVDVARFDSDVRRTHYGRCKYRISNGDSIPPASRRGRKLRACETCVQRKKRCNYESPCSYCRSKNISCRYKLSALAKTGEAECQPACAVDLVSPDNVRASLDIIITSSSTTTSGWESQEGFGCDLRDLSQNSGNLEALENRQTIDRQGDARFGQLQPYGSTYTPEPALTLFSSTFLQLPTGPARPRRMIFLCNFTTSKGIAPLFNFAFSHSRHKSRKSVAQYQKPFPESGNQFQTSSLQSHLTATLQDSLFPGVETSQYSEHPADSQESRVNSNLEGGYSDLIPLMDDSGSGSCLDPVFAFTSFNDGVNALNWVADPLFLRSRDILVNFQKIAAKHSFGSAVPLLEVPIPEISSTYNSRCLRFFSPPNLRRFIDIYWDDWHPHCPIIHRPSFDIAKVPAALITTMALMGAALSPHATDLEMAREWFQPADEIAFHDCQDYRKNGLSEAELSEEESWVSRESKPYALQAAFLICCLQNWEGDARAKTRIRRRRYIDLVDVTSPVLKCYFLHQVWKLTVLDGSRNQV